MPVVTGDCVGRPDTRGDGSELGEGEKDKNSFGETGQQQACEEVSWRTQMMQGLQALPRCFQWNPEGIRQV